MGATVTTGKTAAAFVKKDGTVVYVLFEKTYEKNCHPHTPRWSCWGVGEFKDILDRIFRGAAACEGGMLQGTHGHIRPESYITSWMTALKNPVALNNEDIHLKVGDSFYSSIPAADLEKVEEILAAIGLNAASEALRKGESIRLSLMDDADAVLALYGIHGVIPPWKVFEHIAVGYIERPDMAPAFKEGILPIPSVEVLKIDDENRLVRIDNGPWECWGWEYSAIGKYVTDVACKLEKEAYGMHKRAIKTFRNACASATNVPDDAVVSVQIEKDCPGHDYYARQARELAANLGIMINGPSFSFTVGQFNAVKSYGITHCLSEKQMSWSVPEQHRAVPANPADIQSQQQLIFA